MPRPTRAPELELVRSRNGRHGHNDLRLRRREPPDRPLDRRPGNRLVCLRRLGRQDRQDRRGATTSYTLDLASSLPQVIAETTGSSTTAYAFADQPLEIDHSGTTYWYQADTLGSVRMLTDASGNSASSYNYSAFGATRTSSGSVANEVRFTGERTDTESGLEFLRARTYDPATGTFLRATPGASPRPTARASISTPIPRTTP